MPKVTIQPTAEETPLIYHLLVDGDRRGTVYFPTAEKGLDRLYKASHDLGPVDTHYADSLQKMLVELATMATAEANRFADAKKGAPPPCDRSQFRKYDPCAIRALPDRLLMGLICDERPDEWAHNMISPLPTKGRCYCVKVLRLEADGETKMVYGKHTNETSVELPILEPAWYDVGVTFFPDGFDPKSDRYQRSSCGRTTFWPESGVVTTLRYSRPRVAFEQLALAFVVDGCKVKGDPDA